jgi:hypothetical protein
MQRRLSTRRARNALGTATQSTRGKDSIGGPRLSLHAHLRGRAQAPVGVVQAPARLCLDRKVGVVTCDRAVVIHLHLTVIARQTTENAYTTGIAWCGGGHRPRTKRFSVYQVVGGVSYLRWSEKQQHTIS